MPTKKLNDTTIKKKIDFDALEGSGMKIDLEGIAKLTIDEVKEILLVLKDLNKEEEYKQVYGIYVKKKEIPIQVESLGHRIWSIFYDKWICRIYIIILGVISSFLMPFWNSFLKQGISLKDMESVDSIPKFLMASSNHISLGGVIFIVTIILTKIIFTYVVLPLKESKTGSTFIRSNMSMKVVQSDGNVPSFVILFLRNIFRHLPFSLFNIIMMEFRNDDRGFHDVLFDTYVVRLHKKMSCSQIKLFLDNYKKSLE